MSSTSQTDADVPVGLGAPASSTLVTESLAVAPVAGLKSRHLYAYKLKKWALSPRPLFMLTGFALFFSFWLLAVDVLHIWRFKYMPGLGEVIEEWTARHPKYGVSIFTAEYYSHTWVSLRRVLIAFAAALSLGVPLGLFMGWYLKFKEYTFPVFEVLRPIPILAWVPLAILMFKSEEGPVIFLTFLSSFFATSLNTLLGVQSIDRDLIRAAYCLGSKPADVFRHVVIPGAMPYVFIGLQIAMGVAWFSLVAGEMIAGRFGLGYLVNTAYTTARYPTIVIAMFTLGFVGWLSSALIRFVGNRLMQYRARVLSTG
ncbi:MAG: ABC transporter permease [Acidimicrobiia bacterium]